MDKIKILVACHKAAKVYQDEVYTPIQVGKALHLNLDLGYLTDDTGDNISKENEFYCELTAIYWAWKNLNCEYVGLQHYRRYFDFIFNSSNVDEVFNDCDVVIAKPLHLGQSVFDFWRGQLVPEDVHVALKLLEAMYPDDYAKGYNFFASTLFYPCNMFVCKKQFMDEFAAWEFPYLKKLKEIIRLSDYSRERRILGFIGEGLLPLYFFNRGYRIKTMGIVSYPKTEGVILRSSKRFILMDMLKKVLLKSAIHYDGAVLAGLQQDGILDADGKLIIKD